MPTLKKVLCSCSSSNVTNSTTTARDLQTRDLLQLQGYDNGSFKDKQDDEEFGSLHVKDEPGTVLYSNVDVSNLSRKAQSMDNTYLTVVDAEENQVQFV